MTWRSCSNLIGRLYVLSMLVWQISFSRTWKCHSNFVGDAKGVLNIRASERRRRSRVYIGGGRWKSLAEDARSEHELGTA